MKFSEILIRKYLKSNLHIKNIINILNKNGFEINNKNLLNSIKKNKKYIIKKVIKQKKISKYFSYIKFKINKKKIKIYIKNIKENILNKYILINYNEINIKKIFFIKKKQFNIKYIYILYYIKNKKKLKKINNFIEKNNILEINIPNNRIDCNNIYGLSREIYLLIKKKNILLKNKKYKKYKKNKYLINIEFKKNIINYKYIIINNIKNINKNINNKIKNQLKFLQFNIYNNIKDIINYNLIELGQEIIYFDLDKLKNISIIKNNNFYINKKIFNLNKKNIYINKKTKNIIFIAPLYKKNLILKKNSINNKYKTNKYISNFNKNIQNISLYNIAKNIKNHYGGIINNIKNINNIKIKKKKIKLSYKYINKKIGFNISKNKIYKIIKQIKCKIIKKKYNYIYIYIPIWRIDLNIKEDIIEEIIKIYGYNKIPIKNFKTKIIIKKKNNYSEKIYNIKNILTNIGYKEIINFHFENIYKQKIFSRKKNYINIINPISNKMSILRTSLIPNLLNTLCFNTKRQQDNIKIFEIGTCFKKKNKKNKQDKYLASIIYGNKYLNNWYIKNNKLFDYYDIKGDLEHIFIKQKKIKLLNFSKSNNFILDKFQNLDIKYKKKKIGYIGMLNNKIKKYLKLKHSVFLFEIKIKFILKKKIKKIKNISKFPNNIRDITIIINQNILINKIIKECILIKKNKIKKINIIKIYSNNKLIKKKKKNITIRLYIQDNNKNLTDIEINTIINKCKYMLKKKFNALIN